MIFPKQKAAIEPQTIRDFHRLEQLPLCCDLLSDKEIKTKLDKLPIEKEALDQILFTADFLVGSENQLILAQILKGSKAKAIKETIQQSVPGYGSFS